MGIANGMFSNAKRYAIGAKVKLCPVLGFTAYDFGVDEDVFIFYHLFQGQIGTVLTEDQYCNVCFPNGTILKVWEVHLEEVDEKGNIVTPISIAVNNDESISDNFSEKFAQLTESTIGATHTIHRNKKIKKWVITFNQYLTRDHSTHPLHNSLGYTVVPYRITASTFEELMISSIQWIEKTAVNGVLSYKDKV